MNDAANVINQWLVAANAHDARELAALYSPRAQLLYAWGELLDGRDSITAHFTDFFRAFPNWSKEAFSLIQSESDWAVVEWQAQAAFLGPYKESEPTGRSFRLRGCGVFHVVNGHIRLHRRYLDRRDWFQQMGLR